MPLRDDMHLISTDDHLVEHPRVWLDRLPSHYHEAGPRIVEADGAGSGQLPGPDAPPGPYTLLVGMYDSDSGERLDIFGTDIAPIGDAAGLTEISVLPAP